MRFTLPLITLLTATTFAVPNPKPVVKPREDVSVNDMSDAILFAVEAADCNVGDCVTVVASAVCIIAGIAARSVSAVTACVQGGAGSLCPCANCVAGLGDFLTEHGLCPN